MSAITHLLTSTEFLWGIGAGLVGLAATFALRRRIDWGIVWSLAVIAALWGAGVIRSGGLAPSRGPGFSPLEITAAIAAAGIAALGIWALRSYPEAALAVAISIGGIWATVPDTERAAALVGVTGVLVWAWWPTKWASPGLIGAVAVAALTAWVATRGGLGRDTGLIGALGSIATLGVSAFVVPRERPALWLGAHTLMVAVWSRWAGLSASVVSAVAIGLVAAAVIVAASKLATGNLLRRAETR